MNAVMNNCVDFDDDMVMINIVNEHAEEVKRQRQMEDLFFGEKTKTVKQNKVAAHKGVTAKKIANILLNFVFVLSVLFLIWVLASWVNVVAHNSQPGASEFIWGWNFFNVFFGH